MKYIDQSGQGNTLLILTDAESRMIRMALERVACQPRSAGSLEAEAHDAVLAFNRGIARGTAKMAEESKAEWKARKK